MESAGSLPMESVENVGRKEIFFPTEENVKISVSVDHRRISSILIGRELHALKGPIIGALSDATPALLCHKEPARRKNTPY